MSARGLCASRGCTLTPITSRRQRPGKITLALTLRQSDPRGHAALLFICAAYRTGQLSLGNYSAGDGWARFATEMRLHLCAATDSDFSLGRFPFTPPAAMNDEFSMDMMRNIFSRSVCASESDGPALFFAGHWILALTHTQRGLQPLAINFRPS